MGNFVYLNGQILPSDKAQISANDRGFLFGDGLIETFRTYKQAPFMLKSHLNRLAESAKALGINMPDAEQLKQAVYDCIEKNAIAEAKVRITLTRGSSLNGSLYEEISEPTVLITASELNPAAFSSAGQGVKAISGEDKRSFLSSHKNLSMMASVASFRQVAEKGAFDMIQVTRRGFVTEGLRSNVFIVLDGILLTPPLGSGVLAGITRQIALNIARRNGLKVEEDGIVGQDLNSAEEIFLTNSISEIVPVTSLNGQPVAGGQVGRLTSTIQKGYCLLVENWLEQIGLAVIR